MQNAGKRKVVEVVGNNGSPNGWDTRTWGLQFLAVGCRAPYRDGT